MINRSEKKSIIIRIIYNQKFLAFLGLVLIVLISFPLARTVSKRYRIDEEVRDLEKEIVELESRNKDFKELITYLESDQFVEEQARLNLGLKKEGEEVVVIKEQGENVDTQAGEDVLDNDIEFYSNPRKWWYYFFIKSKN